MVDVALVTNAGLPHGWIDDQPLVRALQERGLSCAFACWDDPSVQWATMGLAVLRSTWDYHERPGAFLDWVDYAASVTTLVNDAATVRWNAHKGYLLELAATGVPVVPTTLVRRGASHPLGDGDWVVKPAVSIGAWRTTAHASQGDLDELVVTHDALVQPYLGAIEQGELSIVCVAGVAEHVIRKVPRRGDFRTQEQHGASVSVVPLSDPHRTIAAAALGGAPSTPAFARVDVVPVDGELLVMELELIEPTLWLEDVPATADRLADHLSSLLGRR